MDGFMVYAITQVVNDAQGFPKVVIAYLFTVLKIATHLAALKQGKMESRIYFIDDILYVLVVFHTLTRTAKLRIKPKLYINL